MTDLIKRLEEAKEGSADLDREVERALGVIPMGVREDGTWGRLERPWTQSHGNAAGSLVMRVLPGWAWENQWHQGRAVVQLTPKFCFEEFAPPEHLKDGVSARGKTIPLALCAAILKATDTGRE